MIDLLLVALAVLSPFALFFGLMLAMGLYADRVDQHYEQFGWPEFGPFEFELMDPCAL